MHTHVLIHANTHTNVPKCIHTCTHEHLQDSRLWAYVLHKLKILALNSLLIWSIALATEATRIRQVACPTYAPSTWQVAQRMVQEQGFLSLYEVGVPWQLHTLKCFTSQFLGNSWLMCAVFWMYQYAHACANQYLCFLCRVLASYSPGKLCLGWSNF